MSRQSRIASGKSLSALLCAALVALFAVAALVPQSALAQSSVRPPANATTSEAPAAPVEDPVGQSTDFNDSATGGAVPGGALGTTSDSELWRDVRRGVTGNVTIPDEKAGVLVQSAGEDWRLMRNGPLFDWLGLAMVGTVILLALFFALRGRIRVEHGLSGVKVKRFSTIERTGHWLMAISFIILGLSGLNLSYGRDIVMPIIGKEAFGPMSYFLKMTHNYVGFAFMLGLAIAFVMWVVHNFPNRHDLVWLLKAGGLFSKHSHPPSKKFNAGQKIIFWLVMIGGVSLSLSGWALLFPFEHTYFADTFAALKGIGIDVPALLGLAEPPYSAIQEQQFNSLWHAIVAVFMICVILAHIYIGSIGMEGAFDAMGSGEVDLNWAREHHSLWVEELQSKNGYAAGGRIAAEPAE